MSRLSSVILAATLAACTPAAAPPAASPPSPGAPTAAAPLPPLAGDETLEVAAYASMRVPPAERAWRGPDYAAAASALAELAKSQPRTLPRAASPRSGALFARMVSPDNVAFGRDRSAPLDARLPAMLEINGGLSTLLRAYIGALKAGAPMEREVLALMAFSLHVTVVQWELADEMLVRLDPDDPSYVTRLGGVDRMRKGTAEMVAGAVASMGERYARDEIATFVRTLTSDLPALVRRTAPREEVRARMRLSSIAESEADAGARKALGALLAALDAPPPADVTITSTAIYGRDRQRALCALPADRTGGVAPSDKRNGASDLFIVPLFKAFEADPPVRAVIEVDPGTPYRLLVEVLFTLGQEKVGMYDLSLLGRPGFHFTSQAPRLRRGAAPSASLNLTALVTSTGIGLKASGGNIAPGCDGVGAGITFPMAGGRYDINGLRACVQKLKQSAPEEREATFAANPGVPMTEVFAVVDALRGDALELFPDIRFAVAR